ncbi:tryptophan-rich sensory protein [Parvibaculum sedimenti]|uniref:Tryptophan-rich sensory protein n=1 Tax=Parvibaculum sedimenti TaxID=2608632 RepID=A0A6N6VIS2_9HYPH|nr:tryptophan-rich sensory protein [Parvibaculum sedimenti]
MLLLFGFLAFVFAFAGLGGYVTSTNIESWYVDLQKPSLTPANWVFPVVWNFLYFLMGLSGWLVWRSAGGFAPGGAALSIFGAQIMLNFTWSVVFFGLHSPGGALVEIFVLLAAIVANIIAFWRVNMLAGLLLLPYLAWSLFATYLTAMVWLLND